MRKFFKILKLSALILILIILGLYVFIQIKWDKKFDAPYPEIAASKDSSVIARGEYLVYGPAHCAVCHVPLDKVFKVDDGLKIPLSGGWEDNIAGFGVMRAPNLTPDNETGIGKLTDAQLARSIRHMVSSDGRIIFPFMEYQEMSDQDVTAVISFLRNQEPVNHDVKSSEYKFLAKALIAFGMFKPKGPENIPPKYVQIDTTIAYGKYLANDIGNCRGCHIKMDNSGKQIGTDFSGGFKFHPTQISGGYAFMSPNITPHPTKSAIGTWTEQEFITRFKSGRKHKGSPMPWGAFSRMNETDMKALYRYLHSLEPVDIEIPKTVYAPGEKLPE
jgi:hypothetical protein